MKRIIAIILLLVMVLSLSGCSFVWGVVDTLTEKPFNYALKEYRDSGVSIMLPMVFYKSNADEDGVSYTSTYGFSSVSVRRESWDVSRYDYGVSKVEYLEAMREMTILDESGAFSNIGEVHTEGDLSYFSYDTEMVISFRIFSTVLFTEEWIYIILMFTVKDSYDEYEPYFKEWAATVKAI